MKAVFDHVAVAAATRAQGRSFIQQKLGVELPIGGEHPAMSTHNCVTNTGPFPLGGDGFFEVIAINPDAPYPGRPRWFGLDANDYSTPRSAAWIVGVEDLDQAIEALRPLGIDPGEALSLSRGDLNWRLTVPADGSVPLGGTFPQLIEWPQVKAGGDHPAKSMGDVGVRIDEVILESDAPELLIAGLAAIGADHLATVKTADKNRLRTVLSTPSQALTL